MTGFPTADIAALQIGGDGRPGATTRPSSPSSSFSTSSPSGPYSAPGTHNTVDQRGPESERTAFAALIVNASAGTGCTDKWAQELIAKFRANGLEVQLTLARSGAEIIDTARQAVADGVKLIVAGGGDGTQSAVASVLAGTQAVHGVLALGTLNHFARDLNIPVDLDAAIRNIAQGTVTRVDVGQVNDRIFINNSGLGLYPDLVRDRERQQRRLGRGKWPAFALATLAIARRFPFLDVRLRIDGTEHRRRTPFVFIGNNQYQMEGFNIGVRERIDEGTMCLYMAHRTGRLGLLRLALHALTHRLAQARDFDMLNSTEMFIATHKKRVRVSTDGEVTMMSSPLHYRIHKAALQVIVPARS